MTTTFSWLLMAACFLMAAYRLPQTIRGKPPHIFWSFLLLGFSVALSITPLYMALDGAIGSRNIANLILRLCLFGAFLTVGTALSDALLADRARKWIIGWRGIVVLSIVTALTMIFFFASDLPGSSPGLWAFDDDQDSVQWYAAVGRTYPAYIAALLVPSAVGGAALRTNGVLLRTACFLIASSLCGVILSTILQLTHTAVDRLSDAITVTNYWVTFSSICCFFVGTVLLAISRVREINRTAKLS